jgi:hypothetical protein
MKLKSAQKRSRSICFVFRSLKARIALWKTGKGLPIAALVPEYGKSGTL